jgi:hypothetical protein
MKPLHVLGRHFKLVLSQSEQSTKSDVGIGDTMLPGREELQLVPSLQDCTIVCRNVEAGSLLSGQFRRSKQDLQ